MIITDELLKQIRTFGLLDYSIEKIIHLLEYTNPDEMRREFEREESPLYKAYHKGKATGGYNLDKSLFDMATRDKDLVANAAMHQRLQQNRINDLITENFGC